MEYSIKTFWNGDGVNHDYVNITLNESEEGMMVEMKAPFFDSPSNPGGKVGQPFDELWEYEVVELFFLDSKKQEYLEAEFCPHGQHQILVLRGCHKPWKMSLELNNFNASIVGKHWTGTACLPWGYFPDHVDSMNAFAIHGSGSDRHYESLYPISATDKDLYKEPNFHLLQYFQPFKLANHSVGKCRDAAVWE